MLQLLTSPLGRLRIIAFLEGLSFLIILFVTMPLKYGLQMHMPNKICGMAHGVLFVLYVIAVVHISLDLNWKIKKIALALLASVIPFGTFWADKKLFRED